MNKPILLKLARWLVVLLAVAFLWLKFASDPVSTQPFETVKNAVTSFMNLRAMQEGDNQMVRRFYGLDPAQFEDCALYYPLTNMEAEELFLVKLKDTAQADDVRAAVEKRLEAQKAVFDGYGVEQYNILCNFSRIEVRGNYILFVVGAQADTAVSAFRSAL